ncbi:hypothetical protein VTI74DRAFT_4144 [Chaetomium olivicolor]
MDHDYYRFTDGDEVPHALQKSCPLCASASGLLRCGGCKVVSYCGPAHQSAHRSKHKAVCDAIKKTRQALEREEAALRASSGNPFETGVGNFWGIFSTRDYMKARFAAADALLKVDTVTAVEKALEHFSDMLHLCRADNLGVRDVIPGLLLRLGREQECYDFLKWFATVDDKDHYNGQYDWGDPTLPYLDIRNADAFEPIDMFFSGPTRMSLSHLVMLTLLKLRLLLDLGACQSVSDDFTASDRPVGRLVRSRVRTFGMRRIATTTEALTNQYHTLCRAVNEANPHFWDALVDDGEDDPAPPPFYSEGSVEEAQLALYQCKKAWQESEDAIVMIEADTCSYVPVYEGPAAIAPASNARSVASEQRTQNLARRRGVGDAFPSVFKPTLPSSTPTEHFPATRIGRVGSLRFVSGNEPRTVLVYADGACSNNGQPNPRAGWAVVYGPASVASGRLEDKGPFGDDSVATSNRAELRAVIAALRLCDWNGDGFNSVVIATDSSYVIDGATGWAKGWVRNGWKTRTGGDVKNRDLWEMLLGEVERWKDRGLRVALWRIPRDLNAVADTAAKEAAEKGTAEVEFRDVLIGDSRTTMTSTTTSGTHSNPHILALCLESEGLFDDVWGNLVSQITSRAKMERATTPSAALSVLNQEHPPTVILVADGAIARQRQVWKCVIDRLRGGATVVLAGCFSSMVTMGQFDRFFARLGLPWRRGSYHRETVKLRRHVVGARLANRLPAAYSQKALFVKNVDRSAVWYTEEETSNEAAVVFAEVGSGRLGYVGDVNGEEGSDAVVLAMCGLLD